MKNIRLTASSLRILLSVGMFVIIGLAGAGFSFGQGWLKDFATDVSHTTSDAEASNNNLSALQQLRTELEKRKSAEEKAASIVADSKSYQYQDQIISDLTKYANDSGVAIDSFSFSSPATSGAPAAQPNTNPVTGVQTPGAASGTGAAAAPTTSSGLRSVSTVVTLQNPVDYNNLLKFIRAVEHNVTKMQIAKISLTSDTDAHKVSSDALTIEVYVK